MKKNGMLRTLGKKVNRCFQTHNYPCTPGTQGRSRWVRLYSGTYLHILHGHTADDINIAIPRSMH